MAQLQDGVGMAEAGYVMPPCDAVISGEDPRHGGAPFINQIFFASSGGGGGPVEDGFLCLGHVGAAGVVRRDGVEMNELRYPIRIEAQRVLADSEGAGRRRGAPGNYVEYGPVGADVRIIYSAGGSAFPALGVRGGGSGGRSAARLRDADGVLRDLPADGDLVLRDGERVISIACGGGGYGDPLRREVERVAYDVAEGWVTPERAREVYGVMVDRAGLVDQEATERRRAELVATRERLR